MASPYAYAIQSIHGGPVKLGKATNPKSRLSSIQTGHPQKLQFIWLVRGNGDAIEARLHQVFASKRGHGEWFNLTAADIAALRSGAIIPLNSQVTRPFITANMKSWLLLICLILCVITGMLLGHWDPPQH